MEYLYFLEKAVKKHGKKYIYPHFDKTEEKEKVRIICPEHGEFS